MKNTSLILWVITAFVMGSFALSRQQTIGYQVGDKAADFRLKNIDGNELALADFKEAKGFILVFTCNHCPCAAKYEDRIIALDKKYKTLGYPVIAINSLDVVQYPVESLARMKARAAFKKYSFPYLSDENQEVAISYGAPTTPYVFVLKKLENNLVVQYTGAIDDNMWEPKSIKEKYVENAIDQLLEGKKVVTASTTAFGCTINIRKKG
jgi:peroxiredoxin